MKLSPKPEAAVQPEPGSSFPSLDARFPKWDTHRESHLHVQLGVWGLQCEFKEILQVRGFSLGNIESFPCEAKCPEALVERVSAP